jgi:hypothetical protein
MQPIQEINYSIHDERDWTVGYAYKGYGYVIKRPGGGLVCNVAEGLRPEEAALARMISATPDLLEAAIHLVEWYGRRNGDDGALFPITNQPLEIQRAMKAIAKVNGVEAI